MSEWVKECGLRRRAYIQTITRGTNAPTTKPTSIIVSIIHSLINFIRKNKKNKLVLTSRKRQPPMLRHLRNLRLLRLLRRSDRSTRVLCSDANSDNKPTRIQQRLNHSNNYYTNKKEKKKCTHRHAFSMANIPPKLPFAPLDAAERPEKSATIPVASICRVTE